MKHPMNLDRIKPDTTWVCLPPHTHGEAELALVQRRIPFFVEKPITNDLALAKKIAEAIDKAGSFAGGAYLNRYRRSVNRANYFRVGNAYKSAVRLTSYACLQLRLYLRRKYQRKRNQWYQRFPNHYFHKRGLYYVPSLL